MILLRTRQKNQPNSSIKPAQRWLDRGLVYADLLTTYPANAIDGQVDTITGTKVATAPWGLARGFGSTVGVGTTDKVQTSLTTHPVLRTYVMRARRDGTGGGGLGRYFATNSNHHIFVGGSGATIDYQRPWSASSGGVASWNIAAPSAGASFVLAVSYDASSTANAPKMYIDGTSRTVTTTQAAVGTLTSLTDAFFIGNRSSDNLRNWDGLLSDFYVFDAILTDGEIAELVDPTRIWQERKIWVPVTAAAGNPALTGNSVTASVGTLTPSESLGTTGNQATGSQGTVAPTLSLATTGNAATSNTGTPVAELSIGLAGQGATASAGVVSVAGSGAVALSGNAATASAGTLTPSEALGTTGNAATASTGSVSAGLTNALTGNSATAAVGAPAAAMSLGLSGSAATASSGTVAIGGAAVALSGNSASASVGTATAALSLATTGNSASSAQGVTTPGLSKGIAGNAATSSVGTPTASLSIAASGNSANAAAGSVQVGGTFGAALSGNAATLATGSPVPSLALSTAGNSATVSVGSVAPGLSKSVTGSAATSAVGSITAQLTVAVAGNQTTASPGQLVVASGNITVALSGVSATCYAGLPSSTGDELYPLEGMSQDYPLMGQTQTYPLAGQTPS